MKKISCYAAYAAMSVLALVSCVKEELVDTSNGRELHFIVKTAESAPVKSYITSDGSGTYTPSWHKDDEIAIFTAAITANTTVSGILSNTKDDGAQASFDGVVTATESGVFKAIYPAGRVKNGLAPEGDAECVGVNLGDPDNGYVQNPVSGSFDPLCDILVSKPTAYTSDGETVASNDVYFKRVMSVVKVVLKGSDAANQAVSAFTMNADGATLSGRAKIDVTNARVESWTVKNSFVKAAFAESNEPIINDENKNAFFLEVNPVTLPKDSKLTITAETATHYINKEITLPRDIVFPEGQMAVLNITINKDNLTAKSADNPKYLLVKDVAEITIGSEIIIVAAGSNYALGTTQGDKNRNAVSITKSSDKASIENIDSDVQVFTVQAGTKENTVAFYTGKGYIYAASSSANLLKTQDKIDDNASWSISISTEGIATIAAQGKNTRNLLKKTSNSALFSCYSSEQSDVAIYINSKKALGTPQNLSAIANGNSVTVFWGKVDHAQSYKVTCGENSSEVSASDSRPTVTFEGLADGLYEISVVATTLDASFKDSEPATTSVRVGEIKNSMAYFSVNGVTDAGTEYEEGATIAFPENPTIDGVDFMGWTTTAIDTPQKNAPDYVSTAVMERDDITFYAVFATKYETEATEALGQTLAYDTWTYSGSTTNKSSYRLFHKDSYIESAEFDLSKLSKVIVYGGTYGGTDYNSLTIGDGTNTWKSVTVSGSSQTGVNTYTNGTALTGTGTLRITSNSGKASDTGVRISKVEIFIKGGYYYDDYCTNVVTLSSIAISGTPTTKEYTEGAEFDPSGLTVTGTYSDGNSKDISTGIIWTSNPNPLTEGTTSVTVTAKVGSISSAEYVVTGLTVTAGSGSGEGGNSFNKLTSSLTDYSGEYLMLHSNDYVVSGVTSKHLSTVNLNPTVGDQILVSSVPESAAVLTIAESTTSGYYTIKLPNGNYLGWSSSTDFSTNTTANTDNYLWSISITDSSATIKNKKSTRIIMWSASKKEFRPYDTVQSNDLPVLYKKN